MISILVDLSKRPDAHERIAKLLDRPGPLLKAAGARVANDLRDHFQAKNAQPNKRNWPKRNFWNRIRSATALESSAPPYAVVRISDPAILQKYYGGRITPKRGKYLTIPAHADAYRAGSPREMDRDFLEPIYDRNGRPLALVERWATKLRRTKKGFKSAGETRSRVWYFLVKSVTQQPDPEALPAPDALEAGAADTIQKRLDLELARSAS